MIDNFSLDKGTPIFSSPQLLTNQCYSAKCDVWSLGCLVYFLYYSVHPFMDKSVHDTVLKIEKMTKGKDIVIQQGTHPYVERLLKKCLKY